MTRFGIAFVLALAVSLVLLVAPAPATATATATSHVSLATAAVPADTVPDRPPVTVSDFFPDQQNLSDCLGLVERPGCGSEARGGWRQTLVFAVLVIGLALIFWRISRGIKANRTPQPPTPPR